MFLINITPGDLDAFLSVAETNSFRKSAEGLGISQPSVSARIQHLETVLNIRLFDRTTRRVQITDAGERLRARVERMVLDMRGLVREFKEEATLQRGRVRLGASPSVAASFLPRVIGEFRRRWPAVEIELVDDFFGQALDRIERGEVDMAVTPFVPGETALDCEPLFDDVFRLALPEDHPLAGQKNVSMAELRGENIISMPPESAAWALFRRAFASADLEYAPALQTRDSVTIVSLIKQGVGVGLVSGMISSVLDMTGVVVMSIRNVDLTRTIGVVRARDRAPNAAETAFLKLMRQIAAEYKRRPAHATAPNGVSVGE